MKVIGTVKATTGLTSQFQFAQEKLLLAGEFRREHNSYST